MAKKVIRQSVRTSAARTISTHPGQGVSKEDAPVVAELLKKLAAKPPTNEQKAIRRKLRSMGHTGGLRQTVTSHPTPRAAKKKVVRKVADVKPAEETPA